MAARFPSAWLDELRNRTDIVQVVSQHVQLNLKGGRYWGLCPFHGEKTPSFSVNPQRQMYYCFGCHASGSAITFIMEMEHLEFREAVTELAMQAHMDLPQMEETHEEQLSRNEKERLYDANRECARFFHAQLWKPENAHILEYFHRRGVSDHTIRKFGLGSTPASSEGATRALHDMGFTTEELVMAGISVARDGRIYDMFRSRAMFPIIDARGRVLAFGGRALGDAKPKYLNTGDTPIFNKRLGVFAANLMAKERGLQRVILTEGYMDVIALTQAGLRGVCATLGTALTIEQARLLKRQAPEIWVSYDGDSAGQHAILRALDIFMQENIPAKVLDFPDGLDPDEYIQKFGPEGAANLTPIDGVTYRMLREAEKHEMSTQEGRTEYAKACAKWLVNVREPVELENYIQRLMIETGFAREVLLAQIGRSEMIAKEEKPIYTRTIHRLTDQQENTDSGLEAAEQQLLRLLADGGEYREAIKETDFITERNRNLAKKLLSGMTPGAILEEIADDAERGRAAEILQKEDPLNRETDLRLIQDCLNRIREKRIDEEIEALKAKLGQADAKDKKEILERVQTLMKQRFVRSEGKEG